MSDPKKVSKILASNFAMVSADLSTSLEKKKQNDVTTVAARA